MNTKLNEPLTAAKIIGTSALHSGPPPVLGRGQGASSEYLDRVCSPPTLQGVLHSPVDGKHNAKTGALVDITIYKMNLYCVFCILFTCIIQFQNCKCTFICV